MRPINEAVRSGRPAPVAHPLEFAGPLVCTTIADALDATTCAHVVRAVTPSFESAARDYPPSYRDNDRAVVDDAALARALFRRLRTALPERVVDRNGGTWRLVGLNERFRFCRYRDGQCFRIHRDGAHAPSPVRRSLLTLQIYLDEDFGGGHTRFYESRHGKLVESIVARTGCAIVFDHDLWHDGEAVTRGTKHVLRTDVIYERERAIASEARGDVTVLEGHTGYVFSLLAAGDGAIVSGSRDRTIRRWTSDDGTWRCSHVLRGHTASVLGLVEPEPGIVWSGSRDRTVREWDLSDGTSRVVAALGGAVLCLESLGDGVVAAGTADATIVMLGAGRVLAGHRGWVWSLASLGGGLLASGSEDATIRIWDVASGECITAWSPGRGAVHALAALDDGTLAAGFADGHVVVYAVGRNAASSGPIAVYRAHEGEVYSVAALSGDRLVTAGEDDEAHVLGCHDGARTSSLAHGGFVRDVVRLGDGAVATASYDTLVRIWKSTRS